MPEFLLYERQGEIGLLTINRPEALNALNSKVLAELSELLDEIKKSDIRCLVVTGAGEKAFIAGADVAEMKDMSPEQALRFCKAGNEVMDKLERLPIPVIAAINGYALGGGLELALACDIRIAAENAVCGLPETSLGILPGYGGVQRLARLVGVSKAKELVFTCERIPVAAAYEIGLVKSVVASESLMDASLSLAKKIAANSPVGVRAAKAVANASVGLSLKEAFCAEAEVFATCFETDDRQMAMNAFLEKKKPEPFFGR